MLEDYLVVDLEMTGLNPRTDEILEIGAVKVKKKQIADTFSCLLRPNRNLSAEVRELTGITQEMASEGEEPDAAVGQFIEFAEDFVWVGHNIIYDYSFIKQWAVNHRISFSKYAVDTLMISRKCLPKLEKKSLDYLCDYFEISRKAKHRAFEDAAATRELYERLEGQFAEEQKEVFVPKELHYKLRRQTPATPRQKNYLKELAEYHRIILDTSVDRLSRSEASRLTDRIIHQYGRIPASIKSECETIHP